MAEAEAIKGRELRQEVRRIRSVASRDRHGNVVWLDLRLRVSTWLLPLLSLVCSRIPLFWLWGLRFRSRAVWRWGLNKLSLMPTSVIRLPLARLPFSLIMNIITSLLLMMVVGWLLWRLILLIAWPLWCLFDVSQA
jgi:hypothetical protein